MDIYTLEEAKNVFIISDFHFGHKRILDYCNRPFATVDEMNEVLLNNYNRIVKEDSLVYFLGDMSFGRQERKEQTPKWWCEQLPGTIVTYIKGSHDHKIHPTTVPPKNVQKVLIEDYIEAGGHRFRLIHDPATATSIKPMGEYDWLIHGHVHNSKPIIDRINKSINVSVEVIDYTPISLYDIILLVQYP
jgi:calcineurin-like phosphoesterase family protein